MNKMIQRQELVPPWIEKQQELVREASLFRSRLRESWKRHVARMISSRGGSLDDQVAKAEEYARAEEFYSSRSQSKGSADNPEASGPDIGIFSSPFRDPAWIATEKKYLELAVTRLNSMTRSYNLMAPELAKKPYFSLNRELSACYAKVAPEVPKAIRDRTLKTNPSVLDGSLLNSIKIERSGGKAGNESNATRTIDFDVKEGEVNNRKTFKYGLRQFWRDLWKPPSQE